MKMTKMTALLLAAAMALTACGSTAAASSTAASEAASVETTAAPEATAAPEEPAAETAVTYPLTVTDQLGREVTIEEEPKTLASGYYISTSLLIALGVQNELVGVEAKADKRNIYSLSAPEIQSLPSIGTAKEFDLEGCAALAPDLVIVPAKLKDSIPQMEEMGLTVLAVKPETRPACSARSSCWHRQPTPPPAARSWKWPLTATWPPWPKPLPAPMLPAFTWQATAPCWKPQAPPCIRTR